MTDYLQIATSRWKDRKVSGSGRFALVPLDSNDVRLYQTHREARVQILDWSRVEIVDLDKPLPAPAPKKKFIRDLGWE